MSWWVSTDDAGGFGIEVHRALQTALFCAVRASGKNVVEDVAGHFVNHDPP